MDFSSTMAVQDKARVQVQVDAFNAALGNGRVAKQVMDKDDFLKILITQLPSGPYPADGR
jgi:flagellar hook assembly protein FlgD